MALLSINDVLGNSSIKSIAVLFVGVALQD
jgi:hypothetical protein